MVESVTSNDSPVDIGSLYFPFTSVRIVFERAFFPQLSASKNEGDSGKNLTDSLTRVGDWNFYSPELINPIPHLLLIL